MPKKIYKAYGLELPLIDVPHMPFLATRAPAATDREHAIGDVWIYKPTADTGSSYVYCGLDTSGDAIWVLQSPGASDVDTLTGDGGGAISPTVGTIIIAGGTNITTVGTAGPGTITINLDAAITLATSVTTPLITSAAAFDLNVAAGSNITFQMGDAVGANVIDFENSASATVATLSSVGTLTVVNMDGIIGATTPAAGTFTTVTGNTSVSSILYTSIGATDTLIEAQAGEDVILRLGDNAGVNYLRIQDVDDADVLLIDSNGGVGTLAGLTVAGAFAQTAGTFNVGQDNAANAINIGGGTTARAITIASGAALHTVAIGSAAAGAMSIDTAAGISLDAATASNFTVTGAAADLTLGATGGSINIAATEADAQAIVIDASDAAGGIDVDCGTGGFDLLATGGAFSIDGQLASNITVTSAGLDLSLEGVGCAVNMTSNQAENDAIYIEASAANGGVQINAGTGGILIGNEADCTAITLGLNAPTATRDITIGGGTVVTAAVTDTINVGTGGATTNANSIKTVNINTGGVTLGEVLTHIGSGAVTSGTHTVNIQSGNAAAGTVATNISTGTGTKNVNIGNADAGTTMAINGPTAINTNVNAAFSACVGTSTGTVTLGNIATSAAMSLESSTTIDLDAAGIISINSTVGAINVGNDDIDQAVNIGTDGERTVTVGSVNGAAALVLQSGTGEITVTGTVKQIDAELMGTTGVYIPTINMSPVMTTAANTGGVATGATGDVNLMSLQNQAIMEQFILGAAQTIIAPRMSANGLLLSLDLTVTEGAEYNFGAALDSSFGFTVGTDGAFFFELDLYINDMDGADPYIFGFRKTEANNATFANYTDYYAVGMNAGTSITNVVIFDELNSTGQTITDTTDAWGGDGTTNTLRVNVSAAGICTTYINGVIATASPAFTFDADRVTPFIRLTHSASPTQVAITGMRIGLDT